MRQTTVARLFDDNLERLRLRHICGSLATRISVSEDRIWPADMVGHLNLIHPDRVQVLGSPEILWYKRHSKDGDSKGKHHFAQIMEAHPPAIIVADDEDIPSMVRTLCANDDVALFASPLPAANVIDMLRSYLSLKLAERVALHGVLMDVLGLGVFITGDSGAGKSELALELISRGHGLVADDIVEFSRIAPTAGWTICSSRASASGLPSTAAPSSMMTGNRSTRRSTTLLPNTTMGTLSSRPTMTRSNAPCAAPATACGTGTCSPMRCSSARN